MDARSTLGFLRLLSLVVGCLLCIGCSDDDDDATTNGCAGRVCPASANGCSLNECEDGGCVFSRYNDDVECGNGSGTCMSGLCMPASNGSGGSGGDGGAGGSGGTGGVFSGTITGEVLDQDDRTGLADVLVRAIRNEAGVGSDTTDQDGFEIQVSEPGDYELCAIGVLEDEQRWVSTDCEGAPEDTAMVTESTPDAEQDLNVTTGYYLEITIEPPNVPVGLTTTTLTLDYRAWNRLSVPNGTTWIALGIEGEAQAFYEVGNAGRPPGKTESGVSVPFTPASLGEIFARLIAVGDEEAARRAYDGGFGTAKTTNYVPIGEVVP